MYVFVYCQSLSPLCTFSISMMSDEDLLHKSELESQIWQKL